MFSEGAMVGAPIKQDGLNYFANFRKKTPVLEIISNQVRGLRFTSHLYNMIFFHASAEPLQHIAYSAPIFLEDLSANAFIFWNSFTSR